ncbi:hypothetical protein A4X06_0g5522 [Tilletia controversa]|uniref:Reverse transcriptase n=1 Tax=Tilletia controversa TaxID=13291 RepID=A0A8X7MRV6_9BASI|nr:hypothetical protein A4X06_0g5522 [Tilletia controversa]
MRGEAKDWFDSLFPRPTTWQEWRATFFQKWTEDPSSAALKMLNRMFKPTREALSTYRYDKYWLIGMESVARLLIYKSPGVDAAEEDVMPLLNQRSVSELVGLVHNGLPTTWQTRLYEPMETATSWNDYLLKMTKKESYIRAELNVGFRSTPNDDDSDTDMGAGRTTWRRGEGGRFRKRGASTKRTSKTKARTSAVASSSRSNPAPLTEEERRQRKKAEGPRKWRLLRLPPNRPCRARLPQRSRREDESDESSSGSSSNEDEEDSCTDDATSDESTSEHDVRRVRSVKIIRKTSTRPSGREPGTLHRNTTTFKLCVRVEGQDRYERSEISLISTRALRSVAPDVERLPAQQIELHGFDDGDRQMTKSVVVLSVTFVGRDGEEKTEWCEFHEVDRCADGWLLGVDNMVEVGVVCDPTTWTATFRRAPAMTAELIRSKDKDRTKQASSTTLTAETADGTSPIDLSGLSQEESTTFRELEIEYPHGSEAIQVAVSSSLDDSQQEALLTVIQSQQRTAIEEALREHDELNLSEPGTSPHSSGVVLVPQRDKLRFCVDYRPLNSVTKDVSYFSPKTDEIYGLLTSAVFLTIVDCNKGYHQFACTERTRQLTAFITMFGTRLWNRMPFGPKTAPAFFQRVIGNILAAFRFICAIAYLDDILVFSPTYEQHLVDVRSVLSALGDAGITIAPKKCAFAFTSLKLLGYRAHALGIMVDEERTRAVREFPVSTTAKEALRFYAMASWYRKFVENFATRAKPVNEAIHSEPFRWSEKQQQAFDDLKRALTTAPILRRPDYARPFILDVDASAAGFGAALIQLQEDGKEHPVVYISRKTKSPETRYGATDLELQCVVWAVSKLAHYIDGSHLTVRSDHQALKYLWDLKSEAPTGRLQRLALALAPLRDKIKVEYRKGSFNNVADALSRSPLPEQSTEQQIKYLTIKQVQKQNTTSTSIILEKSERQSWATAYNNDKTYRRIYNKLKKKKEKTTKKKEEEAEDDLNKKGGNKAADERDGNGENNGGEGTLGGDLLADNGGGTTGTVVDLGSLVGTDTVVDLGSSVGKHRSAAFDSGGTGTSGGHQLAGNGGGLADIVVDSDSLAGERRRDKKHKTDIVEDKGPKVGDQQSDIVEDKGPKVGGQQSDIQDGKGSDDDEGSHPRFFVEDDLLFERSGPELDQIRICVPEDKIQTIIDEFHKPPRAGHPSVKRTTKAIKTIFTFPDLNSRVLEAVAKCYECQTNKARHHKEYGQLIPIYSPPKVFDTLGIDFVTGLIPAGDQRFDAITVVSDKFSKFAIFYASKTTDSAKDTVERFLTNAYPWTGIPRRLISDRDVRFTSEFWRALTQRLDIKHGMSAAYHPQTDGQVERLNQQLGTLLRHTVALDQHDWPMMLPAAMMAYNTQTQETTQEPPYKIVFARNPRVFPLAETLHQIQDQEGAASTGTVTDLGVLLAFHADVQDRIIRAQDRQSEEYNRRHLAWTPSVNDWELVRTEHYKQRLDPTQRARANLSPKLMGPFRVAELIRPVCWRAANSKTLFYRTIVFAQPGTYQLEVPPWFKAHPVFPVQALERFHGDPTTVTPRPLVGTTEEGSRTERRVSAFLGRRPTQFIDGQRFDYLVKWAGGIEPTWQCDERLPGMHLGPPRLRSEDQGGEGDQSADEGEGMGAWYCGGEGTAVEGHGDGDEGLVEKVEDDFGHSEGGGCGVGTNLSGRDELSDGDEVSRYR